MSARPQFSGELTVDRRRVPCSTRFEADGDFSQLCGDDTADYCECKYLVSTLLDRISDSSFQVAQINPSNLPRSLAMVK